MATTDNHDSRSNYKSHRKRDYIIIGLLVFSISILVYAYSHFSNLANDQLQAVNSTLKNVTKAIGINSENTKILANNQKVIVQNQKVTAKGLNDLGSTVISKVNDIKNDTDLIADIKFDVTKVLNQSLKNITIVDNSTFLPNIK